MRITHIYVRCCACVVIYAHTPQSPKMVKIEALNFLPFCARIKRIAGASQPDVQYEYVSFRWLSVCFDV